MHADLTDNDEAPLAGVLQDIASLVGRVATDARLDRSRLTMRPLVTVIEQTREAAQTRRSTQSRGTVSATVSIGVA
jgi:hypothetical protein